MVLPRPGRMGVDLRSAMNHNSSSLAGRDPHFNAGRGEAEGLLKICLGDGLSQEFCSSRVRNSSMSQGSGLVVHVGFRPERMS